MPEIGDNFERNMPSTLEPASVFLWSEWQPLREPRQDTLMRLPGLYCIRRVGYDGLDYVGQTGLALVEQRVGKVDHWTTSDQKQRWLATTLLELEPRLRRLRGYRALLQLRAALKPSITQAEEVMVA